DLWTGSVAVDNAFLPEHVRQIMVDNGIERFQLSKLGSFDAPNDIGGTQEEINVFTQWQWGVGLDYRIPGVEWDLALSWQQGESKRNSQGIERIRFDRMFLGMDAVREPGTGAIVCRVQLFDP